MAYPITAAGQAILDMRGLFLIHLWRIVRKDDFVLLLTDHDRSITYGGELYVPARFVQASAQRRDAGLKESAIEVTSLVDRSTITIPDLRGRKYLQASVHQRVVDIRAPWVTLSADKLWITGIKEDGFAFVGTLESHCAQLQQALGTYFGANFTIECQFELGGPRCGKDVSADVYTGVTVLTVASGYETTRFAMDPSTWPAGSPARTDDYYRDGVVEWTVGDNHGDKSPIIYYGHTGRSVELMFPTDFPIQIGDQGTVRPGCDGLLTTCDAKYGNVPQHGGSPYDPGAEALVTPEVQQA